MWHGPCARVTTRIKCPRTVWYIMIFIGFSMAFFNDEINALQHNAKVRCNLQSCETATLVFCQRNFNGTLDWLKINLWTLWIHVCNMEFSFCNANGTIVQFYLFARITLHRPISRSKLRSNGEITQNLFFISILFWLLHDQSRDHHYQHWLVL